MARRVFEAVLVHPDAVGAWTYLAVPFSVQEIYGSRGPVAVKGTVNGAAFRSTLLPQGDNFHILVVNKEMQRAANAGPGDVVKVEIELDKEARVVELPDDFAKALASDPQAQANFNKMPYSHKKAYVAHIEEAKRAETRASRIEKALDMIRDFRKLKS